jgi:hypothetical protein
MYILVEKQVRVKAVWYEPAKKYAVWDWLTGQFEGLLDKSAIKELP